MLGTNHNRSYTTSRKFVSTTYVPLIWLFAATVLLNLVDLKHGLFDCTSCLYSKIKINCKLTLTFFPGNCKSHKPNTNVAFICFWMNMSHRYYNVVWRIIHCNSCQQSSLHLLWQGSCHTGRGRKAWNGVTCHKNCATTTTKLKADHCTVKKICMYSQKTDNRTLNV